MLDSTEHDQFKRFPVYCLGQFIYIILIKAVHSKKLVLSEPRKLLDFLGSEHKLTERGHVKSMSLA